MLNSAARKTYAFFETPLNKKLAVQLVEKSAKLFLFPPLETEKNSLDEEKIALLKNINKFDWFIFTDVLAVDYFLQTLTENEIDFFELDAVRVCAFGEIVADRLRFDQIHADVIPNEINAQAVFSSIRFYTGKDNLNDLKILLIKEKSANFNIKKLLIEDKSELIELPIYTANITDKSGITKLKILLKGGAIDEFIFSAPEDLIALRHYFADEYELKNIFEDVKASAVDANIFQHLKENQIKAHYFIER